MSNQGSGFELNRLVSTPSTVSGMSDGMSSNGGWNGGIQVGNMNPEYQMVSEKSNHIRHPSVSTDTTKQAEYDVVPENSAHHPPPLPGPRRITNNPVYETRGNTFSHPATLDTRQQPRYAGETEIEPDFKEGNPRRRCLLVCLSILVAVGLILSLAAVALVLLMWFGVYVPGCPMTETVVQSNNCSCPTVSPEMLQNLMDETRALTEQLQQLNSSIENVSDSSSAQFADLSQEAETLSASLMNINSSCLNTLDEVRNSPVSLENTTFRANLTNANIFGSCLYEYLSNCTMDINTESCETAAHPVTVDGYYNLEQTCHVAIQLSGSGSRFAPVNNLVIDSNMMRCSCAAVRVVPNLARTATFTCFLFRARCPISSDFGVPVISP